MAAEALVRGQELICSRALAGLSPDVVVGLRGHGLDLRAHRPPARQLERLEKIRIVSRFLRCEPFTAQRLARGLPHRLRNASVQALWEGLAQVHTGGRVPRRPLSGWRPRRAVLRSLPRDSEQRILAEKSK